MATVALPRPISTHNTSSEIDGSITPPHSFENAHHAGQSQRCAESSLRKHMPVCLDELSEAAPDGTPPASPTKASSSPQQRSLLFPPDEYAAAQRDDLRLFYLTAQQLIAALDFTSCQPLPAPDLMFPWLHGLHPENEIQQCFFMGRKRSLRIVPSCSRGILLVKASGSLSISRLKGAISPDEFMMTDSQPQFIEADPSDGFSVRNFQIQTAKAALISDVVIYGEDSEENENIAWDIAAAQMHQRQKQEAQPAPVVEYNTFVCDGPFSDFEQLGSHLVAIDSDGRTTGNVLDFVQQERNEMWNMTRASEISHNVYLGPSPEPGSIEERMFGVQIECSDSGQLNPKSLQDLALGNHVPATGRSYFDFPSSGSILPPTWSHDEADGIIETCRWIYHLAHGTQPEPDQGECTTASGSKARKLGNSVQRRILIHCADGYTESTLLGIAYHSYSTGLPVPYAWLDLHTTKRRNFFAYPTDVSLLTAIAPRLLQDSPIHVGQPPSQMTSLLGDEPKWLPALDGSFPSRILDYLYLGNLGHANNPALLRELGIGQVLSVGETASWREGEVEDWGPDNICNVHGVQDNGIDPLTGEFPGCLDFIDRGRQRGTATLVHCRVGVSRSATICIAEVMKALDLSFPRAYCFVRARRLNVIIQPHLRFAYELLLWEEHLQGKGGKSALPRRELEWREIAREIAFMNKPYSR